jgi:predicted DNA-binding transcriptional regulator AlpA
MSLSHSRKTPSTIPVLSGPDALRAYFEPRQILQLKESASVVGLSYSRFYRRIQAGTLSLKIRKNEIGERFVLLDDLIDYLFGPTTDPASFPPPTGAPKRKSGRPRKDGGAR